jgi:hypothetical protein
MAESVRTLFQRRLKVYSSPNPALYDPSTDRDRRKEKCDRRRCHTYLARDRRSGIADRRSRLPSIPDLLVLMRRRKQDQQR